jgi:hypothetical protein
VVTVPAGTFATVVVQVQVNFSGTVNGQYVIGSVNYTYWLADRVGVVK